MTRAQFEIADQDMVLDEEFDEFDLEALMAEVEARTEEERIAHSRVWGE